MEAALSTIRRMTLFLRGRKRKSQKLTDKFQYALYSFTEALNNAFSSILEEKARFAKQEYSNEAAMVTNLTSLLRDLYLRLHGAVMLETLAKLLEELESILNFFIKYNQDLVEALNKQLNIPFWDERGVAQNLKGKEE